jgi:Xaa-Pro aminopeptidase
MQEDSSVEVGRKVERVAALAREAGLGAVVIAAQHNFAWLTAGRSNRIDLTRETGSALLAIAADGRRYALANAIERDRAGAETLAGLGFELLHYAWADERAEPALPFRVAGRAIGTEAIGADIATPHARAIEPSLARLRATLDAGELPRYRTLGADCGEIVGRLAMAARPGTTEIEVARGLSAELAHRGITPHVLLVGGDDRIAKYRHPVATGLAWRERLLLVACGERGGQVVALSRMIARRSSPDLELRSAAVAAAFRALLQATRQGATGAQLYGAAVAAYARAGFAGEELKHHQGGPIGYRSREWIAHPASNDVVMPPQAFAWNPSVTGAKLEDTCIVDPDGRIEVVTSTPHWPTRDLEVRGQMVPIADVLVLDA